jgi:hypothetical protein
MKVATPKKLGVALVSAIFSLSLLAPVYADQKPYFKTFGSDVMSGGWYMNNGVCDTATTSNYQDPLTSGGSVNTGGVQAYALSSGSNAAGGASSQFATFALGVIEGNSASSYGFYSDGVSPGSAYNGLNFADSPGWGGTFQGSVRQSHCIPDYYSKLPSSAVSIGSLTSATSTGAYTASGVGSPFAVTGTGDGADVTIAAGNTITIYVNGNAYIDRNIVYQLDQATNVPKFALVALGSIYVDPAVTRLDGLYVAQADPSVANPVTADTGVIWDCHPDNTTPMLYTYPTVNCRNKLTMKNGAMIAKQINLLRVNGDVASANTSEDTLSTAYTSNNIGEVINYSPAMVIGGPFFNSSSSGSSNEIKTDSVISLPPVF